MTTPPGYQPTSRLGHEHHCSEPELANACAAEGKLMERIAAGDQHAFEQLVKEHAPQLQRLIGRLTGWHTDTDDLLQETLIAVWEKANNYDEQGSLHAWLTRIAVNRVKNRYRGLERLRRNLEMLASQLFSQPTRPTTVDHSPIEVHPVVTSSPQFSDEELLRTRDVAKELQRLEQARFELLKQLEEVQAQIRRAELTQRVLNETEIPHELFY